MRKFIKALLVSAFLVAVLGSSSQAFAAKPVDPFQPIFPDFQIEIAHGDLPVNQPIPLTLKPAEIHIFTIPCESSTTLMMVETLGTTETHFNLKGTVHGTIVNDVGYTGTDNASIGFRNEPGKHSRCASVWGKRSQQPGIQPYCCADNKPAFMASTTDLANSIRRMIY